MGLSVFPAASAAVAPKDLVLRQTLTSSGAVTIPAGITHVWAIVVSGGQAGWTNTGSGNYSSAGRVAGGFVSGWTTAANVVVVGAGGTPSEGLGGRSSYGQLYSPQSVSPNPGFIGDGGAGSYYDGQAAAGGNSNFGPTGGTAGGTYTSGGGGAGLLANGQNRVSALVAGAGGLGGGGGGGNGTTGPAGASGGAGGGGCVLLYY